MRTTRTLASLSKRNEYIIVFLVLLIAILLRLHAINYDLPFVYDQDEPMFVTHALSMLKNHDPNPHWFGPPASTTMYLLAFAYGAIYGFGTLTGAFQSPEDFRNLYYSNPTVFYLSGRIISAVFGIATIGLVYKLGRRFFGSATGLMAAAIVALSPIHILLSQQVRMDASMTFLVLLAFWYCLNILEKRDWPSYLLAGFFTGLATVTKYPAIVFSVSIAIAHFIAAPSMLADRRKLLGSAGACIAGAFIGSPFAFFDFRTMLKDVITEARPEHLSATGEGLLRNLVWYFRGPLPNNLAWAGLIAAVLGVVFCFASREGKRWVLVSFPVLFLLFISSLNLRWERWIVTAIPFLALLIALSITDLSMLARKRFSSSVSVVSMTLLSLALFVPLVVDATSYARQTSGPYTSTLAREWLLDSVPANSKVLVEVYGPQLPAKTFEVFVVNEDGGVTKAPETTTNYYPGWEIGRVRDIEDLTKQDIRYFVMTGYYQNFLNENKRYPKQVATYETLMNRGKLVYDVQSTRGASRGPRVRIYELGGHNAN
jgi:4-amino-4-deoxy-L-arabinose transferase-like glycosyltransferase